VRTARRQTTYRSVTDSQGISVTPAVEAIAPKIDCAFFFTADGAPYGNAVTVHTFDVQGLSFAPYEPVLDSVINGFVQTNLTLLASNGYPVYYPASIVVTTAKSVPRGTLRGPYQTLGYPWLGIDLATNGKLGTYEVILDAGPAHAQIEVRQKNKWH
jgi:hypothetical protein